MPAPRTYRIESRTRGIEGPFTAAALISMARADLVRQGDRIEREAGRWVPVESSRELRKEIEARRAERLYLRATSSAAASVSLRFAVVELLQTERGCAELLAIVAQHPSEPVMGFACEALVTRAAASFAVLAREIAAARREWDPGQTNNWDGDRLRKCVSSSLPPEAWDAFVQVARCIDARDGLTALWPNAAGGAWIDPARAMAGERTVVFDPPSPRRGIDDLIASVRREIAASDEGEMPSAIDLSHSDIADLDSLPPDIRRALRATAEVDLSDTRLRRIPSWILNNKTQVNLANSPLEELPELSMIPGARDDGEGCSIDLSGTMVRGFPASWSACEFDTIDVSTCPLAADALAHMPRCSTLRAASAGLRELTSISSCPANINLSGNVLSEFPPALRDGIESVQVLDLGDNRIEEIPDWIMEAVALTSLDLRTNLIVRVEQPLSELPELKRVYLNENRLETVGSSVFAASQMDSVYLSGNRLSHLPDMRYPVDELDVSGNPLLKLPRDLEEGLLRTTLLCTDDVLIEDLHTDDEAESEVESSDVEAERFGQDDGSGSDGFDGEESDDDDADNDEEESGDEDQWDPLGRSLTLNASETLISEFEPSLLKRKLQGVNLSNCRRIASLPAGLLGMPTLQALECDGCVSLLRIEQGGRPFESWKESRLASLKSGFADLDEPVSLRVDISSCSISHLGRMDTAKPFDFDRSLNLFATEMRVPFRIDCADLRGLAEGRGKERVRIESLVLSSSVLAGPIDLSAVEGLTCLDLPASAGPALPAGLGQCTELTQLEVDGIDPDLCPVDLSSLAKLENLTIRGHGIRSLPRFIATLPALENLTVGDTSLEELPGWIGRCRRLQTLNVSGSPLRSIASEALAGPSIRELVISGLKTVLELPDLPPGGPLKSISIEGDGWVCIPESIARCRSLRTLSIGCRLSGGLPPSVESMTWLHELKVGMHVDAATLARLRRALPATDVS